MAVQRKFFYGISVTLIVTGPIAEFVGYSIARSFGDNAVFLCVLAFSLGTALLIRNIGLRGRSALLGGIALDATLLYLNLLFLKFIRIAPIGDMDGVEFTWFSNAYIGLLVMIGLISELAALYVFGRFKAFRRHDA